MQLDMRGLRILERTAQEWNLSIEVPWVLRTLGKVSQAEQKATGGNACCYLTDKRFAKKRSNFGGA